MIDVHHVRAQVVCRSEACGYLGWEHVKSTRPPVLYQGLQNRNIVAQRLATGCGCGHHHISASQNGVNGLRLVGEHLGDVSCFDGGLHWLRQGGGGQRILGSPCRDVFHVDDLQGAYAYSWSDWTICMSTYCSCFAGMSCMYSICWAYVCEVVCMLPCTCMACTGAERVCKGA